MIEYSIIGVGFIMVKYPRPLKKGDTIGITAPSSGVTSLFAQKLEYAKKQNKLTSAPAQVRAAEWRCFLI